MTIDDLINALEALKSQGTRGSLPVYLSDDIYGEVDLLNIEAPHDRACVVLS